MPKQILYLDGIASSAETSGLCEGCPMLPSCVHPDYGKGRRLTYEYPTGISDPEKYFFLHFVGKLLCLRSLNEKAQQEFYERAANPDKAIPAPNP